MMRLSMATRDELVAAIAERYSRAVKSERSRILDEFTAVSGFHRKHAMRLLRVGQPKVTRSTCSSFSTPTGPGAGSRVPIGGQLATLPIGGRPTRECSRLGSCWTIYR